MVKIESLQQYIFVTVRQDAKGAEMRKWIILEIYKSFSDPKIEIKDYFAILQRRIKHFIRDLFPTWNLKWILWLYTCQQDSRWAVLPECPL